MQQEHTMQISEEIKTIVDGLDISEDAKTNLLTAFDAATVAVGKELSEEYCNDLKRYYEDMSEEYGQYLYEEYEKSGAALVEQYEERVALLNVQADAYLTEAVRDWTEKNKVAVSYSIKNQLTESFISGLKSLFEEHRIDIPEAEVDVANKLQESINELKEQNEVLSKRLMSLNEDLNESKRELIFKETTKNLSDLEVEKVVTLAESVSKDISCEAYKEKLASLVETFIASSNVSTDLNEEVTKKVLSKKSAITEEVMNVLTRRKVSKQ